MKITSRIYNRNVVPTSQYLIAVIFCRFPGKIPLAMAADLNLFSYCS